VGCDREESYVSEKRSIHPHRPTDAQSSVTGQPRAGNVRSLSTIRLGKGLLPRSPGNIPTRSPDRLFNFYEQLFITEGIIKQRVLVHAG
jgi:hypothetical protein